MIADLVVASLMLALVVTAAVAYAVRAMNRGLVHNDRVGRIGGTVLLGRSVMDWAYWATDPIVGWLVRSGITPDMLTWSALGLGFAAGVALAFGLFGIASLFATCSTLADIFDGQVARRTGATSDRGELLDAAVDRYTELAFLAGIAIFVRDSAWQLAAVLAAIHGSYMISYASAKAQALAVPVPGGLMRRHERSTYLIAGACVSGLARSRAPELAAVVVVAIVANISAVVRLVRIARALPERE